MSHNAEKNSPLSSPDYEMLFSLFLAHPFLCSRCRSVAFRHLGRWYGVQGGRRGYATNPSPLPCHLPWPHLWIPYASSFYPLLPATRRVSQFIFFSLVVYVCYCVEQVTFYNYRFFLKWISCSLKHSSDLLPLIYFDWGFGTNNLDFIFLPLVFNTQ